MYELHIAWILVAFSFVGAVVPFMPGPPLAFIGAAYYAWQTSWTEVSPFTILLLGVLAIIGSTTDLWVAGAGAKQGGASGLATVASMVGGFIGLLVGNIPGLIIGSVGAIALVEYQRHKDWSKVAKASGGYLAGYVLSMVVQLFICLLMAITFWVAVKW